MVLAIDFAVRNVAGSTQLGSVAGDAQSNRIDVRSGDSVSLNLSRSSVVEYQQQGQDLLVKLVDGRTIVLTGYFDAEPGDANHLYLSSDGEIVEVLINDSGDGVLFADYGGVESWEKWSPLDSLRFTQSDSVVEIVTASAEPAGMAAFIPGLLGGFGGLGTAAAIGGGAVVVGALGAGGGRAKPTVDAQPVETVTTNSSNPVLEVSGTGQPGDQVAVTIGGQSQQTTIGTDGNWQVVFPSTGLPSDGSHTASVVVTDSDGVMTTLTGPNFVIDLTPPDVSVQHGTKSLGDVENLQEYQNGVSIDGRGEPGAAISVQIAGHTQTTTVGSTGSWTVTFTQSQIAAGEYEIPVTITATDLLGNRTVITDTLVVDTVPHPITFNAVSTDNLVSFSESLSGLVVTGASTPGAVISVTLQGVTQSATVGANGAWSVTYPTGTVAAGEYNSSLTATTTDAAGNTSVSTHTFRVDTATQVAFSGMVAGNDIVNAAEAAGGVTMTGTAQAGSSVSVLWNGTTLAATAGSNGTWAVTFPSSAIQSGTYATTATVTATDTAGNTAQASRSILVDTQTSVGVNAGQVGGDNVVSGAEARSGIALTGTAEAGATLVVTFEGVTRTVTAASNGTWSAQFAATEIRSGTYGSTVTVTATDLAGNSASTTHGINVDTQVTPFLRATLSTGTDNVLNQIEAGAGLTVTGTVEAGSTVVARFGGGAARSATVDANGNWTLTIPATDIPTGENSVTLTATATDRFGNTSVMTEQVAVDTTVRNFARTGGSVGGDGMINAQEAAAGITFTGTAEPGASVILRLPNGQEVLATSASNGSWSATFAASQIPRGELNSSVTVTATDRAGNVSSFSDSFVIDTVAPNAPEVTGVNKSTQGTMRGIYTVDTTDSYYFHEVAPNGATSSVGATRSVDGDEAVFAFSRGVPDGSYLVINTQDAALNETSSLIIVNNTTASVIDLNRAGLGGFDFSAIDLTLAPDADLTITEAQLRNLTGPDHRMMIKGDIDDSVHMIGGVDSGRTQSIDGETFRLFTIGTGGASILVDDDIVTSTSLGV